MINRCVSAFLLFASSALLCLGEQQTRTLRATLQTGSFAGLRLIATFSYDQSAVSAQGESYVTLESFNFHLLGVAFERKDILQGGQAVFRDGVLDNVTASFQGVMPPGSQLKNITFGFGGPGVIGYIDLANRFGRGSFIFGPRVVHSGYIADVRRTESSEAVAGPGVEIELYSDDAFPVRDQITVLKIGDSPFFLSRYPGGDLNRLVFTLTSEEFANLDCSLPAIVQYGTEPQDEIWDLGNLTKGIARPVPFASDPKNRLPQRPIPDHFLDGRICR